MTSHRNALAVLALSGLLVACASAEGAPTGLLEDVAALRAQTPVALPAKTPPALVESTLTDIDRRYALVNFYSENQPIVSVCTGDRAGCAERVPGSTPLRTERLDGSEVTVMVNRAESSSQDRKLDDQLATFWKEVPLTLGTPAWLRDGE